MVKTALFMGADGGFVLAAVLSVTLAFSLSSGAWWEALAQAHGHLQVYGWAGVLVLGVSLHFLPRLRGAPLWPFRSLWTCPGDLSGGQPLANRVGSFSTRSVRKP